MLTRERLAQTKRHLEVMGATFDASIVRDLCREVDRLTRMIEIRDREQAERVLAQKALNTPMRSHR